MVKIFAQTRENVCKFEIKYLSFSFLKFLHAFVVAVYLFPAVELSCLCKLKNGSGTDYVILKFKLFRALLICRKKKRHRSSNLKMYHFIHLRINLNNFALSKSVPCGFV